MPELPRLLIIDNDKPFINDLSDSLTEVGYKIFTASTLDTGVKTLIEQKILVVLLGLHQNQEDALETLKSLKIYLPFIEVIILAQKGNFKIACRAMSLGAYDFLVKSLNKGEVISAIDHAYRKARKNYKKKSLHGEDIWPAIKSSSPEFIGQSTAIKGVLRMVNKVAPTNSSVLIVGETGVGKELVARLLHQNSPRHQAPFVTINCGAIPEPLLENELFGHTKGAFTDSVGMKRGLLEEANGGTLFLDEVTELTPILQVKLLRVIETGAFRRLGDNQERWVDLRIVSATNRKIDEEIKSNRFRNDFYYRLAIMTIYIYPLRTRQDDIPLLIEHFLKSGDKSRKAPRKKFSASAMQMLLEYDWPGNVRELKNFVERVNILSDHETITPADVALAIPFIDDYQILWEELEALQTAPANFESLISLEEMGKKYIQHVLRITKNNLQRASEVLKISPQMLADKMYHYSIVPNKISKPNS